MDFPKARLCPGAVRMGTKTHTEAILPPLENGAAIDQQIGRSRTVVRMEYDTRLVARVHFTNYEEQINSG